MGETILLADADRGFALELARAASARGDRVLGIVRRSPSLFEVATGGRGVPIVADLGQRDGAAALRRRLNAARASIGLVVVADAMPRRTLACIRATLPYLATVPVVVVLVETSGERARGARARLVAALERLVSAPAAVLVASRGRLAGLDEGFAPMAAERARRLIEWLAGAREHDTAAGARG
jgi:hypothetical protein